jgi:hypothetical protein
MLYVNSMLFIAFDVIDLHIKFSINTKWNKMVHQHKYSAEFISEMNILITSLSYYNLNIIKKSHNP